MRKLKLIRKKGQDRDTTLPFNRQKNVKGDACRRLLKMAISAAVTASLTQAFNMLGAQLTREALDGAKTLYLWVREQARSPE